MSEKKVIIYECDRCRIETREAFKPSRVTLNAVIAGDWAIETSLQYKMLCEKCQRRVEQLIDIVDKKNKSFLLEDKT